MKRIIILMLICILALFGCSSQTSEAPELLTPVGVSMDTATVTRKDFDKKLFYNGAVVPEVEEVYFEADGILEELRVSYGDSVKKGEVLATLDQEELERQVEELEQQIQHEKQINEYANLQLQYDISICQTELEQQRADGAGDDELALKQLDVEEKALALTQARETQALNLQQLEDKLERLSSQVGTNTLTAPCDGTVVYVSDTAIEGDSIAAYDPVLYIANDNELYIECDEVAEATIESADKVYAKIKDAEYAITMKAYDSKEYLSMLLSDDPVKSRFTIENQDENVEAGDFVVICVEALNTPDALVIPANALYRDEMGRYVYKIVDGKRERCSVETGLITDLEAQILEGLEEGDVVYVKE